MKSIVYTVILAASLIGCADKSDFFCSTKHKSTIKYGSKVRVYNGFYAGHSGTVTEQTYVYSGHGKCDTAGFVVRIYDVDAGMIEAQIAQYDLYAVQKEN